MSFRSYLPNINIYTSSPTNDISVCTLYSRSGRSLDSDRGRMTGNRCPFRSPKLCRSEEKVYYLFDGFAVKKIIDSLHLLDASYHLKKYLSEYYFYGCESS